MDLNKSSSSVDTDVLVKLPSDFFDPNFQEKSHFSNDQSFVQEIDKFLKCGALSYDDFVGTLHNSNNDQDLNLQLITIFQKKIQNYQQKISFFTKTLMEKDAVILRLKCNEGLDVENANLKKKIVHLEQEVAETISLIKRFETKNEMLELKIENLTSTSKEMTDISKKQTGELETRLANSLKIEKDLRDEIAKLKEKIKEEKEIYYKEKQSKSQLDREISLLKSQLKLAKEEKVKIYENFDEERQVLETKQKKIFNSMMNDFVEKEHRLIKELDSQRFALKNYYQAQLETSLKEKVKEYQNQLNKFQQEIQFEVDERERTFNERSMSQLELIVRKNEEEIDLIRRKCREEVELYRIQLIIANRTIDSLEFKLNEYQVRRTNIADNLHNIMETQWKKILDVLSCPSRPPSMVQGSFEERYEEAREEISECDNNKQLNHKKLNNLSKSEENLKSELFRDYIDKVINKKSIIAK